MAIIALTSTNQGGITVHVYMQYTMHAYTSSAYLGCALWHSSLGLGSYPIHVLCGGASTLNWFGKSEYFYGLASTVNIACSQQFQSYGIRIYEMCHS